MIRLFVGIALPDIIIDGLQDICFGVKDAKWEGEHKMHLSLRFIGEVEGSVFNVIDEALSGISAPSFELRVKGTGFFPPRGDPRVIWAGVERCEELMDLQARVEKRLVSAAGLRPEKRKYYPHITLARLKRVKSKTAAQYIMQHSLLKLDPFRVSAFKLYSSILSQKGSKYSVEGVYNFAD